MTSRLPLCWTGGLYQHRSGVQLTHLKNAKSFLVFCAPAFVHLNYFKTQRPINSLTAETIVLSLTRTASVSWPKNRTRKKQKFETNLCSNRELMSAGGSDEFFISSTHVYSNGKRPCDDFLSVNTNEKLWYLYIFTEVRQSPGGGGRVRRAYQNVVRKTSRERQVGRARSRWEDNIKIDLSWVVRCGMD
jgi:hypothetical protein